MNLKHKIQLFSTAGLLIIVLIINTSIYFLFNRMVSNEELERIALRTQSIAEAVKPSELTIPAAELLRAYLPSSGMIRVIKEDGRSIVTVTKEAEFAGMTPVYRTLQTTEMSTFQGTLLAKSYFPIIWSDGSIAALEVTESLASAQQNMRVLLVVLLVASLVVLIPSFIAGKMLSNVILRPIHSLNATMAEIQRSGVFKKLKLSGSANDELVQLGNTFNGMIDILQSNFEKQQQFVSDASHELKTPLTVIESYARMLKRWGMNKPEVLEESIEAIYSESGRMKELANQLLSLARQDVDQTVELKRADLLQIGEDAIRMIQAAHDRPITVHSEAREIDALVDERMIKQLMFILLDNALKYSTSPIELHMGRDDDAAFFSVHDRGIGIPQEDIPYIFDRFYRVDKARSRDTGGTGLGLSIAKQIVAAHAGTIDVNSVEGAGTSIKVRIPVKAEGEQNES
ncbi:sensor histidine kinase [Paenibacillus apiarius]|uniref:histidine kinase n=1 Tax=Paenibacillus apiarius TaxID=46240 RepID=A0ABT4DSF6_9BACL|nr:HAMP domain-containing sensor histidine kinase [Paenibacillus apiarius]MCY9517237.1 HAMP domain-containing histidine kinase [Paenibacillus apiarius]MCY9519168.1 HAMP domain-containing histidine kinase [Paenibacillus apiarius]MCY9551049.1 HAMP domain-containing histidine kinase [Paenibacillus apiarius]MCY9560036.1 HAMP domain-containing histidine kinase [Paenibacillus apiarius]MCY9683321.1 HAMP domain-containing histidine kinase [Paenibacillus apiarius]